MAGPARSKWRRRALIGLASIPVLVILLWIAIHRVRWLGPLLADGARAVLGPTAVARIEDWAYALDDRWKRLWHSDDKPEAYWDVPTATTIAPSGSPPPSGAPTGTDASADASAPVATFRPADVPPVYAQWAAPGDGVWLPIADPRHPEDAPRMWKTLLHPDRVRSWAAVSVVAVDLARAELHLVAGRYEPESDDKKAPRYERPAIIPQEAQADLLGAFNGGFKSTHGHHGMRIDGVTIEKPRKDGCTVALYEDGRLAIRTWERIAEDEPSMHWWRGAPGCMIELGKLHPGLAADDNTYWGSTLEGSTVIRRSAVGLSEDAKVLFVGIGDSTTAPAIARGMKQAGAASVAQLDVNWSYPKFLTYEPRTPGATELVAKAICKGFEFAEDEYVGQRSQRDFFYLTRKAR